MPKMSLLLGRKTMRVFDLDQTSIVVGRGEDADILIDNPAMSRRHAEFRRESDGWVVQDLGSSNGTFIGEERLEGPRAVQEGTEVAFGKFSIVFGKAVGQDEAAPAAAREAVAAPSVAAVEGTMHIKGHEVKDNSVALSRSCGQSIAPNRLRGAWPIKMFSATVRSGNSSNS